MTMLLAEIKSLVKLAAPVSLAQLSLVGMSATDVLIAGRAGTVELAGMNLGVNTWNMVIMFFMGVGFVTQPLVAKQFGAGSDAGVKHQLHQSIWMCLVLGIIAMVIVWGCSWVLQFVPFEADMLRIARNFLLAISLCAIPMTLIPALRGTLEGMSLTREVFLINFMAFLLNIPLDYVLVNGLLGFPKLGGVGCAWATVFLMWLVLLINIGVLRRHAELRHKNLLNGLQAPHRDTIRKTLKLGLPIGASIMIELSMFAGAGMLIATFGVVQASAHAVAITLASISFMVYMGLGQGVTIRASQLLGAEQPEAAWYTVKVGISFNMIIAALVCMVFILFAEPLIRLFSDDPAVIPLAIVLMYFGAAFQLGDCLQVAALCALRAYHDTASPPKYQMVSFLLVGMPLGVGLAFFGWWPGLEQAKGMWSGMVVSLFMVGFLLLWRLLTRARVIHDYEGNLVG